MRALREPRGQTLAVIQALCRDREPTNDAEDERPRLPTDDEIGRELGMAPRTVRQHLITFAQLLDGLEALEPRARIYLWYWHREWERRRQ